MNKIKTLIVICHPDEQSYNHRILNTILEKVNMLDSQIIVRDLYKTEFNPVMPSSEYKQRFSFDETVQALTKEMEESDIYIFIHPEWWGQMPALLKGYIDRVWQPYLAYAHKDRRSSQGLLKSKKALAIITTDSDAQGAMVIESVWQDRVFNYCGIGRAEVMSMYQTRTSTEAERQDFITAVCQRATYIIKDMIEML